MNNELPFKKTNKQTNKQTKNTKINIFRTYGDNLLMAWVNIIKLLGIASSKIIYLKLLMSSSVRGTRLIINKSYFSVTDKTTMASC